jgi:hypothetical protein
MALTKKPLTVEIITNKKKNRLMIDVLNPDGIQVINPRIIYHDIDKNPSLRQDVIDHIKQLYMFGANIQIIKKNKLRITMGDIS